MSKLKKTISVINIMLINKCNKATILTYDDNVIKLLNVLVDFNAIEYYFLTKSSISIKLKYKDFEPILKSIKCLKSYTNKNIKLNFAKKELNNRKSVYLVQTNIGILTLDKAVYNNLGGIVLYRITI
jgi:ribosomal protein S8